MELERPVLFDENAAAKQAALEAAQAAARDYAWKWFEYHAGQRMTVFRFFLILTGAFAAGCLAFLQQRRYGMLAVFAILLMVFTFLFWRLDRRNRELVQIAERYLQCEEKRLADILSTETVCLVRIADQRARARPDIPQFAKRWVAKVTPLLGTYFVSFGQIYQWMFGTVAFSAFVLLCYSSVTGPGWSIPLSLDPVAGVFLLSGVGAGPPPDGVG